MPIINCVLWKWHQPGFRHNYTSEHVNIVADMITRNKRAMNVRIILVTDDGLGVQPGIKVHPLWNDFQDLPNRSGANLPSCYRRLKLFDPETQTAMGINAGERIVSLDLDSVISNDLTPLWEKREHFVGWAVRGTHHLRVFNGSMFMFTAGENSGIWSRFDPLRTPNACHAALYMGSDQSWLSYNFAKDVTCGSWAYPQAVSYPKEVSKRLELSRGTSVVFFHGKRKPWHPEVQRETPWIKKHWHPTPPEGVVNVIAKGAQAAIA